VRSRPRTPSASARASAPAASTPASTPASAQAPVADLTVRQLRDRAKAEGRTGYWSLSKAGLVDLLSSMDE
jgi:hypothetical protein